VHLRGEGTEDVPLRQFTGKEFKITGPSDIKGDGELLIVGGDTEKSDIYLAGWEFPIEIEHDLLRLPAPTAEEDRIALPRRFGGEILE
jgi:hypothetical protein